MHWRMIIIVLTPSTTAKPPATPFYCFVRNLFLIRHHYKAWLEKSKEQKWFSSPTAKDSDTAAILTRLSMDRPRGVCYS